MRALAFMFLLCVSAAALQGAMAMDEPSSASSPVAVVPTPEEQLEMDRLEELMKDGASRISQNEQKYKTYTAKLKAFDVDSAASEIAHERASRDLSSAVREFMPTTKPSFDVAQDVYETIVPPVPKADTDSLVQVSEYFDDENEDNENDSSEGDEEEEEEEQGTEGESDSNDQVSQMEIGADAHGIVDKIKSVGSAIKNKVVSVGTAVYNGVKAVVAPHPKKIIEELTPKIADLETQLKDTQAKTKALVAEARAIVNEHVYFVKRNDLKSAKLREQTELAHKLAQELRPSVHNMYFQHHPYPRKFDGTIDATPLPPKDDGLNRSSFSREEGPRHTAKVEQAKTIKQHVQAAAKVVLDAAVAKLSDLGAKAGTGLADKAMNAIKNLVK